MFLYLPKIFEHVNLIFQVKPEQNAHSVVNDARSGFTLKERKFLYIIGLDKFLSVKL